MHQCGPLPGRPTLLGRRVNRRPPPTRCACAHIPVCICSCLAVFAGCQGHRRSLGPIRNGRRKGSREAHFRAAQAEQRGRDCPRQICTRLSSHPLEKLTGCVALTRHRCDRASGTRPDTPELRKNRVERQGTEEAWVQQAG